MFYLLSEYLDVLNAFSKSFNYADFDPTVDRIEIMLIKVYIFTEFNIYCLTYSKIIMSLHPLLIYQKMNIILGLTVQSR